MITIISDKSAINQNLMTFRVLFLSNSRNRMSDLPHHADLCCYQVTQPVEPPDVGFKVGGFLLLLAERWLLVIEHTHTRCETLISSLCTS